MPISKTKTRATDTQVQVSVGVVPGVDDHITLGDLLNAGIPMHAVIQSGSITWVEEMSEDELALEKEAADILNGLSYKQKRALYGAIFQQFGGAMPQSVPEDNPET